MYPTLFEPLNGKWQGVGEWNVPSRLQKPGAWCLGFLCRERVLQLLLPVPCNASSPPGLRASPGCSSPVSGQCRAPCLSAAGCFHPPCNVLSGAHGVGPKPLVSKPTGDWEAGLAYFLWASVGSVPLAGPPWGWR